MYVITGDKVEYQEQPILMERPDVGSKNPRKKSLLKVIKKEIRNCGQEIGDVDCVRINDVWCTFDEFSDLIKGEDCDCELSLDLRIVFDDGSWLEQVEVSDSGGDYTGVDWRYVICTVTSGVHDPDGLYKALTNRN